MGWKKVESLKVRAVGGGKWNIEKLADDLGSLEPGFYEMSIDEFMSEYYSGDWKTLKQPVIRAKTVLKRVIEESGLNITAYGSPKQGRIALKVE